MLRITADCSRVSAFISAARICFALVVTTTDARSSRLFLRSHMPASESASMIATTAPKPSARRAPIRICLRTIGVFQAGGPREGRPRCGRLTLVDAAADDQVLEAMQVHRLRLDRAAHGVHELVVLPALGVGALGHHLDALLHEVLAVVVAQVDDLLADHLLVGAVREHLALHVVDDHVEVAIDPRGLLAAEIGKGLLAADLLDVGDGLVDHRGRLGCGALGFVLSGRRNADRKSEDGGENRKDACHCFPLFWMFEIPLQVSPYMRSCTCALRHNFATTGDYTSNHAVTLVLAWARGPAYVMSSRNFCMSHAPVGQRSAHSPQCRQTSSSLAMIRPVRSSGET